MTKYRPPLANRNPLLVRQVLDGEAQLHGLAVEMARKYSGFTDQQAIHAFAATISIKATQVLNAPDLEPISDWFPYDDPLDNLRDLHNYARHAHLDPILAFVGLVCLEWDVDSQRVKEALKIRFASQSVFNGVGDYVKLADEISREVALVEEYRIALGAE